MTGKTLAATITASIAAVCLMAFGITASVQHNGTVRETTCVKAGGSYVLTANGSGRECRR